MQITLLQAVIIGLWTAFCYSGMLWGIFTNRALVLSFGVGIVCGDLKTALQCGAIAELAFMGFGVGAGGTVPPNPIGPGIIGTLMAITMDGVTPESALSLSIPFAVAIQFLQTAIYTVRAGAPESANNALKKQDFAKFRLHSNLTILLFALVGFLLGFLGAYSMDTLSKLVALVPAWLLKGLTVAGGMCYRFCYDHERYVKERSCSIRIIRILLSRLFRRTSNRYCYCRNCIRIKTL